MTRTGDVNSRRKTTDIVVGGKRAIRTGTPENHDRGTAVPLPGNSGAASALDRPPNPNPKVYCLKARM